MSLLAQLVDIKPPLKFLLLIFPSLCNSRVCNEKVFSCYHIPLNKGHPDYWDPSWIHVVFIRDSSRIQDPHLYTHAMNQVVILLLQTGSSCTTTCCWHCWLGWTLFFLCFFSGCLSTPFIFICGITTQIAEEYTTSQLACFSLLPAAIEHFVCTLGIEITKPIALKSLMFLLKDISKVTQLRLLNLKTPQRIFTTYQHFARLRLMTSYWCPTSTMASDVMLLLMLPVFLVVSMKGQTEEGYGYSHNEMDCWTDMLVRQGGWQEHKNGGAYKCIYVDSLIYK